MDRYRKSGGIQVCCGLVHTNPIVFYSYYKNEIKSEIIHICA